MTKVAAAKGIATKVPQHAADAARNSKAVVPKANGTHPSPSKKKERINPDKSKASPKPKQSMAELQNAVADISGDPPKDVKRFLDALRVVAARSLLDTNVFKLYGIVRIRMRTLPARDATKRIIFGKESVIRAKPARRKITATALKPFYDAVENTQ